MKLVILFSLVFCGFATMAHAQTPYHPQLTSTDEERSTAVVVPVYEIKAEQDYFIRVDFQNTSENVIRYQQNNGGVGGLGFSLFRDNVFVRGGVPASMMFIHEKDIRELQPGEFVTHRINPAVMCRKLTPGRYELRFRYSVYRSKDRFDLTPFKYESHTIAYIEVADDMAEPDDEHSR